MALNTDTNETIVEYASRSGILYVTVDGQMLYTQKFNEHIKLQIVFNENKQIKSEVNLTQYEDELSADNEFLEEEDISVDNAVSDTGNDETDVTTLPIVLKIEDYNSQGNEDQREQEKETNTDSLDSSTENRRLRLDISNTHSISNAKLSKKTDSKKIEKIETEEINCSYCSKSFKSRLEYLCHHSCDKQSISCPKCSMFLRSQAHYLIHMDDHEKWEAEEAALKSNISEQTAESSKTGTEKKLRKCCICDEVLASLSGLKLHVMTHTGEYNYKCCVCHSLHRTKGLLRKHLSSHLSYRFCCKICNIRFDSRGELTTHQLTHPFPCNLCGKEFPHRTARSFHYRTVHKNDSLVKCTLCSRLYSSEYELQKHMTYHRFKKNTQCPICGVSISRLDQHMRARHRSKVDGSKLDDLLVCDKCPKQFSHKSNLKRHLISHSSEKPFKCSECSKQFSSTGKLHRHLKTHLPDKPYVCDICGKACNRKSNLRVHMQSHTKQMEAGIVKKNSCKR